MTKLITTEQLAEQIGMDKNTAEKWRHRGIGPAFIKLAGGLVRYRQSDVEAWLDSQRVTSTSQAKAA